MARLAVDKLPFGLSTSLRVFTKILKPVLAYAHLHRAIIPHVPGQLVVKPRDIPRSSRANILAQVSVPKAGLVISLEKSDLIPSQVTTYLGIELDTLVGLTRPSHNRMTNGYPERRDSQYSSCHLQYSDSQVLGHLVSLNKLVPFVRSKGWPDVGQHVCSCLPEKSGGGGGTKSFH